jgi:lysozyme
MQISDKGLTLIREFERCRLHVYQDVKGLATIGVGHLLKAGESYPNGITEQQALTLLRSDASWAEHVVSERVKVALTQDAFDALVSFVFNVGSGTLERSSVLTLINAGEPGKAAEALLAYCHAGGKVIDGLLRRRKAEAALLNSESSLLA